MYNICLLFVYFFFNADVLHFSNNNYVGWISFSWQSSAHLEEVRAARQHSQTCLDGRQAAGASIEFNVRS